MRILRGKADTARLARALFVGALGALATVAADARAILPPRPPPKAPAHALAPAGGGLPTVEVTLAESTLSYRVCPATPCTTAVTTRDAPPKAAGPLEARVLLLGAGKHAVHVRMPLEPEGRAWEALVVGGSVVFAEYTGLSSGTEGERSGTKLSFVAADAGVQVPVLSEVREDVVLCGDGPTELRPRGFDPKSLSFRSASLQRLSKAERDGATDIAAANASEDAPIVRLLAPSGSTSDRAAALAVDGDAKTAWTETRPGDGHGELVTFRVPREVPITRLRVVPAATARLGQFYVKTSDRVFAVTVTGAPRSTSTANHDGAALDIVFDAPVRTSCLSLVLGAAAPSKPGADVEAGFAEVSAFSEYDVKDGGLARAVDDLGKGTDRADAAAQVLARAGHAGVAELTKVVSILDVAARLRAMEAAAGASCEDSSALFIKLLDDVDKGVRDRARGRLERCGKASALGLVASLGDDSSKVRASSATMLALLAPSVARAELPKHLGANDPAERRALRAALAKALHRASTDDLAGCLAMAWSGAQERAVDAEVDLLRALGDRASEVPASVLPRVQALLARATRVETWPTRYALADVLATLASKDRSAEGALGRLIASDPHLAVRTHAAELARGATLGAVLARAVDDPEPRVRAAAIGGLATVDPSRVLEVASLRLVPGREPWTFVRIAATEALGRAPAEDARVVPVLRRALVDASPGVREAAVSAVAKRNDPSAIDDVAERAKDDEERPDVRRAAALALGVMCAKRSVGLLAELASRGASPVATEDERNLGLAAASALGRIHPADIASRLEPLSREGASPLAKRAVKAALAETHTCR